MNYQVIGFEDEIDDCPGGQILVMDQGGGRTCMTPSSENEDWQNAQKGTDWLTKTACEIAGTCGASGGGSSGRVSSGGTTRVVSQSEPGISPALIIGGLVLAGIAGWYLLK